jgi:predicted DNA-binding protein
MLLTNSGGHMDKIFSTRIDEAVYNRIGLLAEKLNVSKKTIIERAIMKYTDDVDMMDAIDPLTKTLGSWTREERPEETIQNAKNAFRQSMTRHQS